MALTKEELEELEKHQALMIKGVDGERAQVRIRALVRAKKELELKLAELEEGHKKAIDEIEKARKADRQAWEAEKTEEIGLLRAGVTDPAVVAGLRAHLSTLPEQAKKGGVLAFLEARKAALNEGKADPKKAPAPLPWLDHCLVPKEAEDKEPPNISRGAGEGLGKLTADDILAASRGDKAAQQKINALG